MRMQSLLIISPNRPNPNRPPIKHPDIDTIFSGVQSDTSPVIFTGEAAGRNAAGR